MGVVGWKGSLILKDAFFSVGRMEQGEAGVCASGVWGEKGGG